MKKEEPKKPSLTELVNSFVEKFRTAEDPYTAAFLADNLTYMLTAAGHVQHPDFDFDAAYAKIAIAYAKLAESERGRETIKDSAVAGLYDQLSKHFQGKCAYFSPEKGSNQPSQP